MDGTISRLFFFLDNPERVGWGSPGGRETFRKYFFKGLNLVVAEMEHR